MTTEINITKKRGDTRRITFVIKDANKNVLDISSWTSFLLTVTSQKAPSDITGQQDQFNGAFNTDGTDGKVYFTQSGNVDVGKYFYDCQALDENSEKITFAEGQYIVEQDRTKD